jgi:putative ABC transport system substrate-binding protein
MNRRKFLFLTAGAACIIPCTARAQADDRLPLVAVLEWDAADRVRQAPLRDALRDLGYVEGQNLRIEFHYADSSLERVDALAVDLVKQRPTVLVAFTTPVVRAVKKATSTIPVVGVSADPIAAGIVSNLARPAGNITGVSNMMPDLESKRLELLRELLPGLKRVAFLGSIGDPNTRTFLGEAQHAAAQSGIALEPFLIAGADEIESALGRMADTGIQAVLVQPLFALNPVSAASIADPAIRHRIPAISTLAYFARGGGLMAYGPDSDFGRRTAARYVARILKGAKPADLPIEQPTVFNLTVNMRTAKAIGLAVPESFLLRADEVIE